MSVSEIVKTSWSIDTAHSEVLFKVKHMMVSYVTGSFKEFEGQVVSVTEDFVGADFRFMAKTKSINTNNDQRDDHLKSDDFFNADAYPIITFKSDSFEKNGDEGYTLTGDLTIREFTNRIVLKVEYNGQIVDPYGQTKAGFEIHGKLNRKDFGLRWSGVTDTGGIVVSEEVKLIMNVQLTKQELRH